MFVQMEALIKSIDVSLSAATLMLLYGFAKKTINGCWIAIPGFDRLLNNISNAKMMKKMTAKGGHGKKMDGGLVGMMPGVGIAGWRTS